MSRCAANWVCMRVRSGTDNEFWGAPSSDARGMEQCRKKRISRPVALTFQALDVDSTGRIGSLQLIDHLRTAGIHIDKDPRLAETYEKLQELNGVLFNVELDLEVFAQVTHANITLIHKAISGMLVVPDFVGFTEKLADMFDVIVENRSGNVAEYIPELKSVDPDKFAISVCTVDGQTWSHGDHTALFTVQSTAKPISYMMAVQEKGLDYVHQHVGREPSGLPFNSLALKAVDPSRFKNGPRAIPHNTMINSGAIMICALLMENQQSMSKRFKSLLSVWKKLFGDKKPDFSNSTYLSEKETASRNWCLTYMMQDAGCFPSETNLKQTLDFYFQTCAIEADTERMATLAAALAAGGVNPFTDERIFKSETVRNCLSLMLSTGMYDYSGEWQFSVGVPAKSGVSGVVYLVIPNLMGIAIYSPRLDANFNSARGVQYAQSIVARFRFHMFDSIVTSKEFGSETNIRDPRQRTADTVALLFAAAAGDIKEMQRLIGRGVALDVSDYDSRTALHLSCAEGSLECVRYIVASLLGAAEDDKDGSLSSVPDETVLSPMDRWGRTPLDDALAGRHHNTAQFLLSQGALTGDEIRRRQQLSETGSTGDHSSEVLPISLEHSHAFRHANEDSLLSFIPELSRSQSEVLISPVRVQPTLKNDTDPHCPSGDTVDERSSSVLDDLASSVGSVPSSGTVTPAPESSFDNEVRKVFGGEDIALAAALASSATIESAQNDGEGDPAEDPSSENQADAENQARAA
ncbi:unnamed protein product (mitochondrion) [Plasmodiophora brassicae]|uniref:glutaminase n=1 Tax=Plasmodiophora brassicae TaxID=37360 RepID=A0A3P3Y9H3_PLABS|nr:unnamed protein product [Plasmodiophora brassicae]